jgi:glutamate synthase (NADPH/NADH) small chain
MPVNFQELSKERNKEWRAALRNTLNAKARSNLPRVNMVEMDPLQRILGFVEVNMGLNEELAVQEAKRCLDCVTPSCISGCPVNIDIPGFVKLIEKKDFLAAAGKLKETNALPAVCGRVCPQEIQCEACCVYQKMKKPAVAIGYLERFASDYERMAGKVSTPVMLEQNHIRVAAIGSGPAGLTFAGEMAKLGYEVTVYEALHELAGVLSYGIPEFRLPKAIVKSEIAYLEKLGVCFEKNVIVGIFHRQRGRTAEIHAHPRRKFYRYLFLQRISDPGQPHESL